MFVGDTVWDVQACTRAGVPCIGVRSGGVSQAELIEAGARVVFTDTAELAEHIDDTPIADLVRGS